MSGLGKLDIAGPLVGKLCPKFKIKGLTSLNLALLWNQLLKSHLGICIPDSGHATA